MELMINMEPATILITAPEKSNDPTTWTHMWAVEANKIAKNLGYDVVFIERNDTTYNNVTEAFQKYKPRLYIHLGHGCPSSLQGNTECIVTRKYTVDDLLCMANDPLQHEKLDKLMNPLKASCEYLCSLESDQCNPLCTYDTNIGELKGSIVYAVACHSASGLGVCANKYGVETYIGFNDLLMFPVDSVGSQNFFKDVHLKMFESLLLGRTVKESEEEMSKLETSYIKYFKKTKYIALPMLWNLIHRRIIGNLDAMIYE